MVTVDWENGYVEASAKDNKNVSQVSKLMRFIMCNNFDLSNE